MREVGDLFIIRKMSYLVVYHYYDYYDHTQPNDELTVD